MNLSDPLNAFGGSAVEVTSLRHLVDSVGSAALHVLAAPGGLDRRVRGTVLLDRVDELPSEPDAVLLMTGMCADDPEAVALVRAAARSRYCAVVVKRRDAEIEALVTEASLGGVAVLAVSDEVPWRHLDALLLSIIGSQGLAAESASGIGDELFALANAIAAAIGGSVAIEDLDRRVLAYSSLTNQRIDALRAQSILERRVPDMERNPRQYQAVFNAPGVIRFAESSDEFARAAIAIKAGTQPLGTIWAIETAEGMTEAGEQALVDGARLAALQILRSLNARGMELAVREGPLRSALDGSLSAHEVAFRLSLPGGAELALVGFAPNVSDAAGATPLITHVSSALSRYVAAYRPDAAIATTSRAAYVLLTGGVNVALRFARGALTATHQTFANDIRAAVAFTSTDPAHLPAMRREIDDILRVTTTQPDLAPVARLTDVHARVMLTHVSDELIREPRLRHPGVDAMSAYDLEHRTEYGRSVTAWLDAVGDVSSAATLLGIHANTLRYRLRRVGELFDLSLSNPDDRLSVWLQLRIASA